MSIKDGIIFDTLVPPQDIGTADVDSTVFLPAKRAQRILGFASAADLTSGQTLTVQLLQATNAAGAGKKVLGDAVTQTAGGSGARGKAIVESSTDALDANNNFTHVGIRVGSSANGKVGSGHLLVLSDDIPAANS